eukprot:scaffold591_cov372-Prasinococcus_capsulatus_cf.AAC.12
MNCGDMRATTSHPRPCGGSNLAASKSQPRGGSLSCVVTTSGTHSEGQHVSGEEALVFWAGAGAPAVAFTPEPQGMRPMALTDSVWCVPDTESCTWPHARGRWARATCTCAATSRSSR